MLLDVSVPANVDGFVAGVAAALDFGAQRVRANIAGLTPEQLLAKPAGFSNAIATLVVHLCGAEVSFAHRLMGKTVPDELKATYLLDQPYNPLPTPAGETVESLTAKMEQARSILMEALSKVTAADLERKFPFGPEREGTGRWMLALLPNHQAQHLGHIQMIKKQLG